MPAEAIPRRRAAIFHGKNSCPSELRQYPECNLTIHRAIAGGLITIPTVWYVLSSSNHHPHEPKDAHIDAHTNEIIEEIGEKAGQAQIKEQEVQEEHEEEEKTDVEDAPKDDSASDSEVPSPRTSMVGNNIVNSVPDAKGGSKKRIDSTNALKLGEVATDEPVDGAPADQVILCLFSYGIDT
jgi:hypothetical protein